MAGRWLSAHILSCSIAGLTAAAVVSGSTPPAAAEPLHKLPGAHELASNSAASESLSVVFATRWEAAGSDFAVGKIRSPVGSDLGQRGTSERTSLTSDAEAEKESQNRSVSKVGLADKCGPSPAGPDEIKRLIATSADRHGVDADFALAIAFAESRFDRQRNSAKGGRGPMQLIPEAAARFGVDDICDPAANIDGGVTYLRQLFDEFRNPLLVAAAYNAGENRVRASGDIPPIRETVGFVAEVVNYQIATTPTVERARPIATQDPKAGQAAPTAPGAKARPQWVDGVMQF